jgi:PTS system ascorbate-specific IIA component
MVAVVVIAHRPLASALVDAARHVYSRDPSAATRELAALDVAPEASADEALAAAAALVAAADRGQGVLVLTDLPGATPANAAMRLAQPGRVAVAAGVNLAMLLRSVCYAQLPLEEVLAKSLEGGTRCVQELGGAAGAPPAKP